MRLAVIDNYDSFVYNLVQAFGALGAEPVVVRNDAPLARVLELEPEGLVVSPGPGGPEDAGVSVEAVRALAGRIPVLGVCLGHQCIAHAFGGHIERAPVGPVHGKTSEIHHDGSGVFAGLPSPLVATRYHSLCLAQGDPPGGLVVNARADDGTVMGLRHESLPVHGVQFHPESVLTDSGPRLLENFLRLCERHRGAAPRPGAQGPGCT